MADYDPNIPFGAQNISQGQVTILNNFQQLNIIFDIDHFTWNDGTNGGVDRGMHRKISFPVPEGSDPVLAGTASQFYTKTLGGIAQAFFANSSAVSQLTGPFNNAANGSVTLPGGFKLNFGSFTAAAGTVTQNYDQPYTNPPKAMAISSDSTEVIRVNPPNTAHISVTNPGPGSAIIYYLAIGI